MSSRVFVVHEPVRWNGRSMEKTANLSPAAAYGDITIIFPGTDRPPPPEEACITIKAALASFTEADYLVLLGDTDLVVWAAFVAMFRANGNLRLLKWHNRDRRYEVKQAPAVLSVLT